MLELARIQHLKYNSNCTPPGLSFMLSIPDEPVPHLRLTFQVIVRGRYCIISDVVC